MLKFHYKVDYIFDGEEDFVIFTSSSLLSIDQIGNFALGKREKNLFKVKEIWELDYDKTNPLIQYSLKQKLV